MSSELLIKHIVASIIAKHFGQKTADMYAHYYEQKSSEEVIRSVEELLSEYIGPYNTQQEIEQLRKMTHRHA